MTIAVYMQFVIMTTALALQYLQYHRTHHDHSWKRENITGSILSSHCSTPCTNKLEASQEIACCCEETYHTFYGLLVGCELPHLSMYSMDTCDCSSSSYTIQSPANILHKTYTPEVVMQRSPNVVPTTFIMHNHGSLVLHTHHTSSILPNSPACLQPILYRQ